VPQLVFDTNVLVDALTARGEDYVHTVKLLELVREGVVEGWYAPHSIAAVFYLTERILRKETGSKSESSKLSGKLIRKISEFLKPLPQIGDEFAECQAHDLEDLEDSVLLKLAAGYLPEPLVVTRDQGILQQNQVVAAHPAAIVDRGVQGFYSGSQPIEFIDLKTQQRKIRPELEKRIHTVLHHGRYIMGPEVQELEERLAAYVGLKHCIGVSSGTDSLLIAMMALGIGPGDEVITVPYTWISTAEMIALLGAKPVFVDIEETTFNMDPTKVEAAITERTKAIMPVGIYGQTANMTAINEIAARHGNLPVIEDAAQSFGATHHGRRSCSLSTVGSTSFFPSKPLGCYGDGGALFTDNDELAQRMRQIRVHGQEKKHHHPILGINGRLDTLQAAIVLAKLELFDDEIARRQSVAARYADTLANADQLAGGPIRPPAVAEENTSVFAQYTILSPDRDKLAARLKIAGIPSVSYYAVPLHLQPVFADLGHSPGDFPASEKIAVQGLSLPMDPWIGDEAIERIRESLAGASAA